MEVITIFDDVPEEKIFTPKARRLVPQKKKFKRTTSSDNDNVKFNSLKNSTSTFNEKSLNLDKISIEEINEDFLSWSQNLEEEECFEEINNILSCSTKDCSFDSQNKKNKKIQRPICPKDKNIEFYDEQNICNLIKESYSKI